jgi:hypothetical protein
MHLQHEQPSPVKAGDKRAGPARPWGFGAVFLLLAGYLLFAHGCHGDEDNEPFARILQTVADRMP